MEILNIDVGMKSYQMVEGGAPLIFNPGDPNVYARYRDALDEIETLEKDMVAKAQTVDETENSTEALTLLRETDRKAKEILSGIFGGNNDFDAILCGVNLMAVTSSGTRVIENLMDALNPIMVEGAKACASDEVQKAKKAREQRREESV